MKEMKDVLVSAAQLIKCRPEEWLTIRNLFEDAYRIGMEDAQKAALENSGCQPDIQSPDNISDEALASILKKRGYCGTLTKTATLQRGEESELPLAFKYKVNYVQEN